MDKLELRMSLYKGVRGDWPDPPTLHSWIRRVRGHPPCRTHPESFTHLGGPAQAVTSVRASHQQTHLARAGNSSTVTSLASQNVRGANSGCGGERGFIARAILPLLWAACGTVTRGESQDGDGARQRTGAADCGHALLWGCSNYLINWAEGFGKKR